MWRWASANSQLHPLVRRRRYAIHELLNVQVSGRSLDHPNSRVHTIRSSSATAAVMTGIRSRKRNASDSRSKSESVWTRTRSQSGSGRQTMQTPPRGRPSHCRTSERDVSSEWPIRPSRLMVRRGGECQVGLATLGVDHRAYVQPTASRRVVFFVHFVALVRFLCRVSEARAFQEYE